MTYEAFAEKFSIHLTKQQEEAVKSVEVPTLLLAVPGSGKTTVLVIRLGYMIHCCGIAPERILTITYTVAATMDMRSRFASLFGEEWASRLEFRTINGICAKMIQRYAKSEGKIPFTLIKEEKRNEILSGLYRDITNEYLTDAERKELSTKITYIKNMQASEEEVKKLEGEAQLPLEAVYKAYGRYLRENGLMDYDDQMVYAYNLLRRSPEFLAGMQNQYSCICVDEAQDTSRIQHEIITLLTAGNQKLFMVGDEDQSIYGFRAAYPEALLQFEQVHPRARVLLMEENFRSNAGIVEAADHFIQKNQFRHKKHMIASRPAGAAIQVYPVSSRKEQYARLIHCLKNCGEQTAVLYRDNESALPIVDLLERRGIEYRMKQTDLTFFSSRVVREVENMIRFAMDPGNTELFMQIYYQMGTYLNKNAAGEACKKSLEMGIPVLEAAVRYGEIPEMTRESAKRVQGQLKALCSDTASQAVNRIRYTMGYENHLTQNHRKSDQLDILSAIAEQETTPLRLLERLGELSELIQKMSPAPHCNLTLSTIHSSKGLEYDTVYLVDVKNGIFPERVITDRSRADERDLKNYEEERRLFYVGVTRAKEHLTLFRFAGGSVFVNQLLEWKGDSSKTAFGSISQTGAQGDSRKLEVRGAFSGKNRQKNPSPAARVITESEYQRCLQQIQSSGTVKHKIWGEGKLLSAAGDTLELQFDKKTAKCRLRFMMERGLIE